MLVRKSVRYITGSFEIGFVFSDVYICKRCRRALNEADAMLRIGSTFYSWRRSFPGANNRRPPYLAGPALLREIRGIFLRGNGVSRYR